MKLLAALLVLMIAAQPVRAGFCDLDPSGGADPHAAMQHGAGPDSTGHDCCQSGNAGDPGEGCPDKPCGTCTAGVQAVAFAASLAAPLPAARAAVPGDGQISPSHSSPPFRPPIFVS